MKTGIAVILTILMLFTSTSGLWYAVDMQNSSDGFTPVAKIENDDYVTYADRNKAANVTVEKLDLTSEEYILTVTVMTTATGDPDRGNYVASVPISNALVRLDGVPRFTDKQGRIKASVNKRYVELYVNRTGYNPYIEIIDASSGDKVVNLKKPSDDIDIYSAMFEYQGKMFNLLQQPCYVLRGIDEVFSVLTVESNVEADRLMFYVNGDLRKVTFGNEMYFTDEDFDSYGNEDKFTVRICYSGIYSEYREIFIKFCDYDYTDIKAEIMSGIERQSREQAAMAKASNASDPSFEIGNDEANVGNIGNINPIDKLTLAEKIMNVILPKVASYASPPGSFEGDDNSGNKNKKLNFTFKPDFYNGTFEFLVGVQWTPKFIDRANNKIKESSENRKYEKLRCQEEAAKAEMDKSEQIYLENQKKSDEAQAELNAAKEKFESTGYIGEEYFDAMRKMNDSEDAMKAEHQKSQESGDYKNYEQAREAYLQSEREYQQALGEIHEEYDKASNAVEKAEQQFNNAKTDVNEALKKFLDDQETFGRAFEVLEDFFVNKNAGEWQTGSSFKIDLEFAFMGKIVYSYRYDRLDEMAVFCEATFKVIYSYQWVVTIPTPIPIPVPIFIKVEGYAGFKLELRFVEKGKTVPLNELLEHLYFDFLFGLRVDGGLGLVAANITVGPYGKVDFTMRIAPDRKLIFQWGAGLKIQIMKFQAEFGYLSPEMTLWEKDKEKTLQISRLANASPIDGKISENQLCDRIYYASRPQLIELEGGRRMLIWIEDDADRDVYNSSVVKYSICAGGQWSAPKAVCDDGRGDHAFDVCVKDGEVFVAMQRTNRLMGEQDGLYDSLKALDIFVSKFDGKTGKFESAKQITNDSKFDSAPQFAVVDGTSDVTLTWQSNTNDDFLGMSGENIIYSSNYNGNNWSGAEEIFRNGKPVSSYSCAIENGRPALAIREDKDGDLLTFETTTYVLKDGSRVFESDSAINPQFIDLNGRIAMLYYKEGKLMATEDYLNEKAAVDATVGQEFSISKSGDTPAIFYEGYDGEAERGYCALYIDGKWSTPFSVIDEKTPDADISALTGFYDGDTVYSTYNMCLVDEEDSSAKSPIALCVAEHKRGYDISIEAVALDSIMQGKDAQIMLYVENIGDFDIFGFEVDICNQNIAVDCPSTLSAGSSGYFIIDFVADVGKDGCIEVAATVYDGDKILASDVASIFVNYTDMTVDAQMKLINGKQNFKVNVSNISDIDSAIALNIYVNGELYKVERSFVSAGGNKEFEIAFDEIKEGDYVYFSVESEEREFYKDDNGAGIYSVQTETAPEELVDNVYRQQLQDIKKFMR